MYPRSMAQSDCVVIMGSNMAECHPVAFRWPLRARLHGAKLIHVDPRFTRTSANCDIHAPIRAGSDIAFLGGLINYVLASERWNSDPFFQSFVSTYTNAATIVSPDFKGTEDLDGVLGAPEARGGRRVALQRSHRELRSGQLAVRGYRHPDDGRAGRLHRARR